MLGSSESADLHSVLRHYPASRNPEVHASLSWFGLFVQCSGSNTLLTSVDSFPTMHFIGGKILSNG